MCHSELILQRWGGVWPRPSIVYAQLMECVSALFASHAVARRHFRCFLLLFVLSVVDSFALMSSRKSVSLS